VFGLVVREDGADRLVCSTSIGLHAAFAAVAVFIVACMAFVAEGDLVSRLRPVPLALAGLCLLAALYGERVTFDRAANVMEHSAGLPLLRRLRRVPLDSLTRVVVHATMPARPRDAQRGVRLAARGVSMVYLLDQEQRVHRLDMGGAGDVQRMRALAGRVSVFCGLPLEDATLAGPEAGHGA
jgi:hypothetical protein